MKVFNQTLYSSICMDSSDPNQQIVLSQQAINDLFVWVGFLRSMFKWLPICPLKVGPPMRCLTICSDAAGLAEGESSDSGPGCGCISFDEEGIVIFASQIVWPSKFICELVNENGIRFGDNSMFLEMFGIIVPFVSRPDLFANKRILIKVDNLAVVFGIMNRSQKSDSNKAILIRALVLILAYLESEIFVEHLPRKSDWESRLVDRLSRSDSTTRADYAMVQSFGSQKLPSCLQDWLLDPKTDWDLAMKLLSFVENVFPK
jgi:hypothetical protein